MNGEHKRISKEVAVACLLLDMEYSMVQSPS